MTTDRPPPSAQNFIRDLIDADLASGKHTRVVTRFPPEPNGYLHIGHAKAICLNFGLARDYGGVCHLRMDDTNPSTEDQEYVEAIQRDVRWLGFDWADKMFYASDYFGQLHDCAVGLIRDGLAYVDSQSEDEIRVHRGTLSSPGTPSPYRARSIDENLDLFARMKAGEFTDGSHVLRGKGDLAAANMKLRDPLLYRIRHATHYRTGDAWCIYPMYDFAHPLSDAIEGITHSICTLEFENNRDLYDWVLVACKTAARPQQIEMARLALGYTVMSKRKLLQLVGDKLVAGWDDPRMPTLAGLRRRGISPAALRSFCDLIGVAKANSTVDIGKYWHCIQDDLNQTAPRVMCVEEPIAVVLTNYPKDRTEVLVAPSFPPDLGKPGTRDVPLSREIYLERFDVQALADGDVVRLRNAYCAVIRKPEGGPVTAEYLPETLGTNPAGVKLARVVHWVAAEHGLPVELRTYSNLFRAEKPDELEDWKGGLDRDSRQVNRGAFVEPSVAGAAPGARFQFERRGFFVVDPDSQGSRLVFNRVSALGKIESAAPVPAEGPKKKNPKAESRPDRASRAEIRDKVRAKTPELAARLARYQAELGLGADDADLLTGDLELARFFEAALAAYARPAAVARWVVNEILREIKDQPVTSLRFDGAALGRLVALVDAGTITQGAGKEVLAELVARGGEPAAIVESRGLRQVTDAGAIGTTVDEVLARHPDEVERYKAGKSALLGFLVGQVMKAAGGKASASLVQDLVKQRLTST